MKFAWNFASLTCTSLGLMRTIGPSRFFSSLQHNKDQSGSITILIVQRLYLHTVLVTPDRIMIEFIKAGQSCNLRPWYRFQGTQVESIDAMPQQCKEQKKEQRQGQSRNMHRHKVQISHS